MKKAILISAIFATTILNSNSIQAEPSKEQDIGVASGALTGAALGGPIGLFIGAAIGGLIGNDLDKESQLNKVQSKLSAVRQQKEQLEGDLVRLQGSMQSDIARLLESKQTDLSMITKGLMLNLMFTTNSSKLSDNDNVNIERLSKVLDKFPEFNLKLDGYTDPRGSEPFNIELARSRVNSVLKVFENYGIDSKRIITEAHGEATGFNLNDSEDTHAMARKVSINFVRQSVNHVAQN